MALLLINTLTPSEYMEARARIVLMRRAAGWRLRVYRLGIDGPYPLAIQLASTQAPSTDALRAAWNAAGDALHAALLCTSPRNDVHVRRLRRVAAYRRSRGIRNPADLEALDEPREFPRHDL